MPGKGTHHPHAFGEPTHPADSWNEWNETARKQTIDNFDDPTDILGDTPLNHFENAEVEELLEGEAQEEDALDHVFEAFFTDEESK